jgi:hypothetical protein
MYMYESILMYKVLLNRLCILTIRLEAMELWEPSPGAAPAQLLKSWMLTRRRTIERRSSLLSK